MPSPDQLAEMQNPEILKAFFADVKTSEIQSKLDAIKATGSLLSSNADSVENRAEALAAYRKHFTS